MIMFISVPVGGSASSSSNSNANANTGGGGPFFGGNKYHTVQNFKIQWENRRNKANRCRYHICIFLAWFRSLAKK